MATAELVVAFGAKIEGLEASLKRVTTQLNQLESSAQNTQRGMQQSVDSMASSWSKAADSIRGFVLSYAALQGFRLIKDGVLAVDDLNASVNRLQALTGQTGAPLEDQFRRLADIAARTGQPVKDVTDQFQRFYVATASAGTSRQEVEKLVETLGNFARLSGQGPQEMSAAITQFAQGLASGRLAGDELKSIMENMPLLAQGLARELGVSVGELRKMGEDGKLIISNILPAMARLSEEVKKQLEGIPTTIRQSFQTTTDRFTALIREIDKQVGASEGINKLLQALGATAESIRQRVATVGGSESASNTDQLALERREAGRLIAELNTLRTRREEAAGTGQTRRAAGQGIGSIQQLDEQIRIREQKLNQHVENVRRIEGAQTEAERVEAEKRAREGAQAQAAGLSTLGQQLRESRDGRIAVEREYADRIRQIDAGLAAARRLGGEAQVKAEREAAQARIDAAAERAEAIKKIEKKEAGPAGPRDRTQEDENRAIQKELDRQRAALQASNQLVQAANDPVRNLALQFEQFRDTSGQAGSAYGNFAQRVVADGENMTIGFQAIIEKSKAAGQSLVNMGQSPLPALQAMTDEFERFRQILERAGVAPEAVTAAIESATTRGQEAFAKLTEKADNSFRDIEKSIVQSFSRNIADSLVDFATGAEKNLGEVAASFDKMVAKVVLNWLIFKAVTEGLKLVGIDLSTGPSAGGRINPDATGAPPGVARLSAYGETSPYFTGGRSLVPAMGGAGGNTTVNVINNTPNSQSRQEERSDGMGGKQIDIYIEEVVRRGMMTGSYDNVMGSAFGASRIGRV